jgi:hypothetical protein
MDDLRFLEVWLRQAISSPPQKLREACTPRLNLKRGGKAFLLPLFAPLGTVFDPPIDLRQFKSDVVPPFLGLIPLVPQNLLVLSLEFSVEQRLFHQIVCRARPFRFA